MKARERAQIARTVVLLDDVLGPDLVGVYLHGSAVLAGLRARSDVDLFALTRRGLTMDEKRALVGRLLSISLHPRPIELTVAVQEDILPWHYPPRMDFQYGDWWRAEYERGIVEPYPSKENPDLAPLITMVLEGNASVVGPPPAEVFDPVPARDFVAGLAHGARELPADLDRDTRNVVLTFARIWCGVESGRVQSKDGAADWALARLPEALRPVLIRARDAYLGDRDEEWRDLMPDVRTYADYMARQIAHRAPP